MTKHAKPLRSRFVVVALLGAVCTASLALVLDTTPTVAQGVGSTSAYVTEAPNNPLWLALATPDDRWAIQLADTCMAIAAGTNVTVVGAMDDPGVQLVSDGGQSCGLAVRVRMGTAPCAQDSLGLCDVRNS